MKKIILIIMTIVMVIGLFVISASARDETNYKHVLQFENNKKAYPIMKSKEDAIGFFEYYKGNIDLTLHAQGEYYEFNIHGKKNDSLILNFELNGSYPMFTLVVENASLYTDFTIIELSSTFYLYGWRDGVIEEIYNLSPKIAQATSGNADFETYVSSSLSSGYYVNFGEDELPSEDDTDMVGVILFAVGAIVVGLGNAFSNAFTSVFLTNGMLNPLAIFILCFFGISLAVGLVYYIFKSNKKGD